MLKIGSIEYPGYSSRVTSASQQQLQRYLTQTTQKVNEVESFPSRLERFRSLNSARLTACLLSKALVDNCEGEQNKEEKNKKEQDIKEAPATRNDEIDENRPQTDKVDILRRILAPLNNDVSSSKISNTFLALAKLLQSQSPGNKASQEGLKREEACRAFESTILGIHEIGRDLIYEIESDFDDQIGSYDDLSIQPDLRGLSDVLKALTDFIGDNKWQTAVEEICSLYLDRLLNEKKEKSLSWYHHLTGLHAKYTAFLSGIDLGLEVLENCDKNTHQTDKRLIEIRKEIQKCGRYFHNRLGTCASLAKHGGERFSQAIVSVLPHLTHLDALRFNKAIGIVAGFNLKKIPIEDFLILKDLDTHGVESFVSNVFSNNNKIEPMMDAVSRPEKVSDHDLNQLTYLLALDYLENGSGRDYQDKLVAQFEKIYEDLSAKTDVSNTEDPIDNYSHAARRINERIRVLKCIQQLQERVQARCSHIFSDDKVNGAHSALRGHMDRAFKQVSFAACLEAHKRNDWANEALHRGVVYRGDPRGTDPVALALFSRMMTAELSGDVSRSLISDALRSAMSRAQTSVEASTVSLWLLKPENTHFTPLLQSPQQASSCAIPFDLTIGRMMLDRANKKASATGATTIHLEEASAIETTGPRAELYNAFSELRDLLKEAIVSDVAWEPHSQSWYQTVRPAILRLNAALSSEDITEQTRQDRIFNILSYEAGNLLDTCQNEFKKRHFDLTGFLREETETESALHALDNMGALNVAHAMLRADLMHLQRLQSALNHFFSDKASSNEALDSEAAIASPDETFDEATDDSIKESGNQENGIDKEAKVARLTEALVPCLHSPNLSESKTIAFVQRLLTKQVGNESHTASIRSVENQHRLIQQVEKVRALISPLKKRKPSNNGSAIATFVTAFRKLMTQLQDSRASCAENPEHAWAVFLVDRRMEEIRESVHEIFSPLKESELRLGLLEELYELMGDSIVELVPASIRENGMANSDYTYSPYNVYELLNTAASDMIERAGLATDSILVTEPARQLEANKQGNGLLDMIHGWLQSAVPSTERMAAAPVKKGIRSLFARPSKTPALEEPLMPETKERVEPRMLVVPFLPGANQSGASQTILHWVGVVVTLSEDREVSLAFINPLNRLLHTKKNEQWEQRVIDSVRDRGLLTVVPQVAAQQQNDIRLCGPLLVHIASNLMNVWSGHEQRKLPAVVADVNGDELRIEQMNVLNQQRGQGQSIPFSISQAWNVV